MSCVSLIYCLQTLTSCCFWMTDGSNKRDVSWTIKKNLFHTGKLDCGKKDGCFLLCLNFGGNLVKKFVRETHRLRMMYLLQERLIHCRWLECGWLLELWILWIYFKFNKIQKKTKYLTNVCQYKIRMHCTLVVGFLTNFINVLSDFFT